MNNRFLNSKITIKIFAVAIAMLLWFYVITEQNPVITKNITIPVKLINMESLDRNSFVLMDSIDNHRTTLTLKGKKNILDGITEATVAATVDMSAVKAEGENQLAISISGIPGGINSYSPSPTSIKVNIEPKVSEQRAVEVRIAGNPPLGLAAMSAKVDPADVIITGGASLVGRVVKVLVDIDVTGASSDLNRNLSVRLLDEDGNDVTGLQHEPKRVNITIPIAGTKRVPVQYDMSGMPAEGFTISDANIYPKEVLITGKKDVLDKIDAIRTEIVDVSGATAGVDKEIGLIVPLGIELVDKNDRVRINIDIEEIITETVDITNIEVRNLKEDLTCDPINESIKLVVKGVKSKIQNLQNILKLYVDMKNAVEGTNTVDIMWEKDIGIEILEVLPLNIDVEVRKLETTD
ncbi:MAG: YbbR-like domain-containing protein [Bacillota bacterium]